MSWWAGLILRGTERPDRRLSPPAAASWLRLASWLVADRAAGSVIDSLIGAGTGSFRRFFLSERLFASRREDAPSPDAPGPFLEGVSPAAELHMGGHETLELPGGDFQKVFRLSPVWVPGGLTLSVTLWEQQDVSHVAFVEFQVRYRPPSVLRNATRSPSPCWGWTILVSSGWEHVWCCSAGGDPYGQKNTCRCVLK